MNEKIGRNEACVCGSGKKYKKCCLMKKGLSRHQIVSLGPQKGFQQFLQPYRIEKPLSLAGRVSNMSGGNGAHKKEESASSPTS